MPRYVLSLLLISLFPFGLHAQDISYARSIIDTLTSPYFSGRGYSYNGDKKAADFIAAEYQKHHLTSFTPSYKQPFVIAVNTIIGKQKIQINDKVLFAGDDYFISGSATGCKGKYPIVWIPFDSLSSFVQKSRFHNYKNKFIAIQILANSIDSLANTMLSLLHVQNIFHAKGILFVHHDTIKSWEDSPGFQQPTTYTVIDINPSIINYTASFIDIELHTKYLKKYQTQNVVGFIPGAIADTFVVFSAHYDHLGNMGKNTYFPGAHDNASGTALMLDLARYFSIPENKPHYSICFIACSAEEIGLIGSSYYCYAPLFPLTKIKYLLNLDIVATGSKGIMIENAKNIKPFYEKIVDINKMNKYVIDIQTRTNASNSDHYPFTQKNVPAAFIYTLGSEYKEYHSIHDKAQGLPLTAYDGLFKLLVELIKLN